MIMRIMPLMFFVFAVNVPLAVIIYWVTTNFWSVGQQYILLRSAPAPAGTDAGAVPAPAPALVEDGETRKGLGALSMFRGSSPSRPSATGRSAGGSKNGNRSPRTATGKATPKSGGSAPKSGGSAPKSSGSTPKGAQPKPGQSGRQGTGGNRRSGSRSSGKGKASGPRRGKR
jgi:YidC/Oxa1 family membrane protein insertase